MKYSLFILSLFLFIGCTKDNEPYYPTSEELIGKRFARTTTYVEFFSVDSVMWMINTYRESPTIYRAKYRLSENKIFFEVSDTTRVDYNNPITGYTSFTKTYYYDSFEGVLQDENTIFATMNHSYEERVEDKYTNSYGGLKTSFDLYYTE